MQRGKVPMSLRMRMRRRSLPLGAEGMTRLADFHPILELEPTGRAHLALKPCVESGGNDEGNFVLLKIPHHLLATESAIAPNQADAVPANDTEGLLQKVLRRATCPGVTGTHPCIGYHTGLGHKGQ